MSKLGKLVGRSKAGKRLIALSGVLLGLVALYAAVSIMANQTRSNKTQAPEEGRDPGPDVVAALIAQLQAQQEMLETQQAQIQELKQARPAQKPSGRSASSVRSERAQPSQPAPGERGYFNVDDPNGSVEAALGWHGKRGVNPPPLDAAKTVAAALPDVRAGVNPPALSPSAMVTALGDDFWAKPTELTEAASRATGSRVTAQPKTETPSTAGVVVVRGSAPRESGRRAQAAPGTPGYFNARDPNGSVEAALGGNPANTLPGYIQSHCVVVEDTRGPLRWLADGVIKGVLDPTADVAGALAGTARNVGLARRNVRNVSAADIHGKADVTDARVRETNASAALERAKQRLEEARQGNK